MQSFLIVALRCIQQESLELRCERRQRRRRKWRGSRGRRSRKRQRRRRQWRRRRRHVREVVDGGSRLSPSDPGDPHGEGPWLRSPGQSASAGHTSVRHPWGADYSGEEKLKNCQFKKNPKKTPNSPNQFSANSLIPIHQLSAPSLSPQGPGRPPGEVQERHHSGTPEDQLGREPGRQQPAEPGRWRRRRRRRHGQRVLPTWRFVQRKRKIIIGRSSKKLLLLKVAPTILTRFCKWKKALCPKLS